MPDATPEHDLHARFQPDYTPEQLENLGVYDALYRGQAPRLASLGAWKPEWISEHDPKGWAQWYKRYAAGRRLEGEDERQIRRWLSFKARHGGPFANNPTARRGWALRNWAVDPSKLVPDQARQVNELLDEHRRKAMQKFVQERVQSKQAEKQAISASAKRTLFHGSTRADLSALNPNQANLGAAGVYGADNLDWAALYALAQDRRGMAVLGGAKPKLLINKANKLAPEGYVYEYSAENPTPPPETDPNRGWHIPGKVTPLRKHIVKLVDHMKNIEQFDDKESLRKRWEELNSKTAALASDGQLQEHQQPHVSPDLPMTPLRISVARPGTGLSGVRKWFHNAARKATMAGTLAMGLGGVAAESAPQQRPAQDYHAATFSMLGQQQLQDQNRRRELLAQQIGALNQEKASALAPDVELQEHQQRVSDRVSGDDPRLLLYHGLGSGKSLSAIAAAEAAQKLHGGNYGVVVPASLRSNFQKELSKFAPGSNPEILSYSGLALGKKFQQQPDTLVMDEAQRLRNPESAAARAARDVAQRAKRLVLLSGTPITNEPADMASLISMLTNREIKPKQFEERYVGYKSKFPGVLPWLRGAQWGEVPYVKNEKELRQLLAGKVDYQPSKTPEGVDVQEEQIKVPLSKAQQKIQRAIRTKIPPGFLWKLDKEFPMSREELAKMNSFMNGLRQVSLSTQSFRADRDPLKAFDQSSKLQTALQNLQKTLDSDKRKKALIYSNFVESGVNPYAAALERAKIPHGVFHGGIPTEARQKALRDYNEGKLRALLIGPAGAEGISTKGTNLIQLLDPHWNEARIQQARGRGLRFDSHAGLPEDLKNVQVQRYLSASEEPGWFGKLLGKRRQRTGDEVLENLAQNKEQLNAAFRKILQDIGTPAPAQN